MTKRGAISISLFSKLCINKNKIITFRICLRSYCTLDEISDFLIAMRPSYPCREDAGSRSC